MADSLVLVANATDGTITSYRLADDSMSRLSTSRVGVGCSTFVVDEERDLVHVGTKDGPAIVTCRLDRDSGILSRVAAVATRGNPTYLELAHGGTVLLVAYYHEGVGEARPVIDGAVGEPAGRIANNNLHCVVAASDSRHAYFVSLGDDLVAACAVGPDATMERVGDAPAPKGCGPRHLVLDADGANAYVVTEYSGEILRYGRDETSGALSFEGATTVVDPSYQLEHSRILADPMAEHLIWGADLHLSADGKTLWSTERTESVLSTSPVDGDGTVGPPVAYTVTEPQPRGFEVSPDGRHLIVAGERSSTVTLYNVGSDGVPAAATRYPTGAGSNWVRMIAL